MCSPDRQAVPSASRCDVPELLYEVQHELLPDSERLESVMRVSAVSPLLTWNASTSCTASVHCKQQSPPGSPLDCSGLGGATTHVHSPHPYAQNGGGARFFGETPGEVSLVPGSFVLGCQLEAS